MSPSAPDSGPLGGDPLTGATVPLTTIRIFVSSTLSDFAAEREALDRQVFPELTRRVAQYGALLVRIDPRKGKDGGQGEDVFDLSQRLGQVDAARPFFLGLLGETYGPATAEWPAEIIARYPWLAAFAGASLTELEMRHGALNAPERATGAFFYLRDSRFLADLPAGLESRYMERDPEALRRLSELKRAIRVSGRPVMSDYPCRWDGLAGGMTGLDLFVQHVIEDLSGAILAYLESRGAVRTPMDLPTPPSVTAAAPFIPPVPPMPPSHMPPAPPAATPPPPTLPFVPTPPPSLPPIALAPPPSAAAIRIAEPSPPTLAAIRMDDTHPPVPPVAAPPAAAPLSPPVVPPGLPAVPPIAPAHAAPLPAAPPLPAAAPPGGKAPAPGLPARPPGGRKSAWPLVAGLLLGIVVLAAGIGFLALRGGFRPGAPAEPDASTATDGTSSSGGVQSGSSEDLSDATYPTLGEVVPETLPTQDEMPADAQPTRRPAPIGSPGSSPPRGTSGTRAPASPQGSQPAASAPEAEPEPAGAAQAEPVLPPRLKRAGSVRVPSTARLRREEVIVEVRVLVGRDGSVLTAELGGPAAGRGLDEAAIETARRSTYQPATQGGEPVEAWTTLKVRFKG